MLIVEPDVNPHRTVYFTAGLILRCLRHADYGKVDLATLFRHLRKIDSTIPIESVVPALDFLFLTGSVRLTDDEGIQCS